MTKAMKCATEVAKWLKKNEADGDVSIYVDHKRYSIGKEGELVYDIDAEPKEYFEWAGDFMSMSFEGILYELINYEFEFGESKTVKGLEKIFNKYGKYYELGNAWNLSLYDL